MSSFTFKNIILFLLPIVSLAEVALESPSKGQCKNNNLSQLKSTEITEVKKYLHYDSASSCAKCAACIAVALKFNETFTENTDNDMKLKERPNFPALCHCAFHNFRIRKAKGQIFVGPPTVNSKVADEKEGLQSILSEKCEQILSQYVMNDLYKEWRDSKRNLVPFLCEKKTGFDPCRGLLKTTKVPIPQIDMSLPFWKKIFYMVSEFITGSSYFEEEKKEALILSSWRIFQNPNCYY